MKCRRRFAEVRDEGRAVVKLRWKQAEVFIRLEENALMRLKIEESRGQGIIIKGISAATEVYHLKTRGNSFKIKIHFAFLSVSMEIK